MEEISEEKLRNELAKIESIAFRTLLGKVVLENIKIRETLEVEREVTRRIHEEIMRLKATRELIKQRLKQKSNLRPDYKHNSCRCGNRKLTESPVCRKCYLKHLSIHGRKKKKKK